LAYFFSPILTIKLIERIALFCKRCFKLLAPTSS
jgi:hypothetical protein